MTGDAVVATRRGGLADRLARDLRGAALRREIPLRAALSRAGVARVVRRVARALDTPARNAAAAPTALATGLKVTPEPSDWAGSFAGQVIPPGPTNPMKARWLGFFDGAGIDGTSED